MERGARVFRYALSTRPAGYSMPVLSACPCRQSKGLLKTNGMVNLSF
jgi:hypothetical protein